MLVMLFSGCSEDNYIPIEKNYYYNTTNNITAGHVHDQDLNTSDDVTFNSINTTNITLGGGYIEYNGSHWIFH